HGIVRGSLGALAGPPSRGTGLHVRGQNYQPGSARVSGCLAGADEHHRRQLGPRLFCGGSHYPGPDSDCHDGRHFLMGIRVGLYHKTTYEYDRLVTLSPQIVRLRPAPHTRTPVTSFSLCIEPKEHFINWQQDPQGNFLARLVFPKQTRHFSLEVDLVAEMTVINPFDFFLEPYAENIPFRYETWEQRELEPFLKTSP